MKPKYLRLLIDQFTFNNSKRALFDRTDTEQGTAEQWNSLERDGLVKRVPHSDRSPFGHRFSYRITDKGEEAIKRHFGW